MRRPDFGTTDPRPANTINKTVFYVHKLFAKPKKCLNCLNAKQKDGRVYCYEWQVIVLATHAKICPRFIPRKRINKQRKRRKEVLQWR